MLNIIDQSVRSEMEKSFIGQEDQMSKLRTEVGANLNSLNYDISGLLQFKNESGKENIHHINTPYTIEYIINI